MPLPNSKPGHIELPMAVAAQPFEKFFTLSLDLLCIASPDATFKLVNPVFTKTLGYSQDELVSKPFLEFIHPDDIPATLKEIERLLQGQETTKFENRYRHQDGSYRILEWSATTDLESGDIYAVARDVTSQKLAELESKKLSARLEQAELLSKMGFWELDLTTFQCRWSAGQLALYGLRPTAKSPSFEGQLESVHVDDRDAVRRKIAEIVEQKISSYEMEYRLSLESGKDIRHIKQRGAIELCSGGTPSWLFGSDIDITESKNHELEMKKILESLKSTASHFERTSEMAKIGSWELDLITGVVELSKETQRLHEIDSDYVPPKYDTGSQWYPPESWPTVQAAVTAAIERGIPYDLECPFITAKGRNIWVRVQGFPVFVEGKVTKLHGTFQDITLRKQADIESKLIGDTLGFGVWKFDPAANTLDWDDRMYTLYGVKKEDFSGAYSAWENALSPETRAKAVSELNLALIGEKDFNTEFEIILKNGESRYLATRAIVTRNDKGEPVKMYGLNWDVTTRVKSELELKSANLKLIHSSKLASLGEMSAGIAHEINNPLAIILGSVGLLSKFTNNPEKFAEKIEAIKKATARISRIVKGLRKFSRSSEKAVFGKSVLSNIIKETLVLTESKATRHGTSVTTNLRSEASILCDEVEIEQVFVNLINNAIDAVSDLSQKWVVIDLFDDHDEVVVRVSDSGPGIPQEIVDKIFNPFFTTKEVGEGTGLGLSITKGILAEHHATIAVAPEGPHTCFEIRFRKA
jgi:PAS domain S-box-containing protein